MCGIAGYSLSPRSSRRSDARGPVAAGGDRRARRRRGRVRVPLAGRVLPDRREAAHAGVALLDRVAVPAEATQLLVHVRDYTKGHPSIAANNHPVRHGPVIGIHNGIIVNDDELLAEHAVRPRRAADDRRLRGDLRARGALAERPARARGAARVDGRGVARRARARAALRRPRRRPAALARRGPRRRLLRLDRARARDGRALLRRQAAQAGARARARASPSRRRGRAAASGSAPRQFVEQNLLPAVRAPEEREFCLSRLATIAAAALAA